MFSEHGLVFAGYFVHAFSLDFDGSMKSGYYLDNLDDFDFDLENGGLDVRLHPYPSFTVGSGPDA